MIIAASASIVETLAVVILMTIATRPIRSIAAQKVIATMVTAQTTAAVLGLISHSAALDIPATAGPRPITAFTVLAASALRVTVTKHDVTALSLMVSNTALFAPLASSSVITLGTAITSSKDQSALPIMLGKTLLS